MVEVGERSPERLKPIAGVSGEVAVFDAALRDALVWAAHHYVAPVSVLLERAAPPNLPGVPTTTPPGPSASPPGPSHPLDDFVAAVLAGRRRPVTALLAPWGDMSWVRALQPVVAAGRSVLVVAATAAEVGTISRVAGELVGPAVLEVSGDLTDAESTDHWAEMATRPGRMVIGTPRVACWPVAGLAVSVALEEGRRAMKDRQTPTMAVRRMLGVRSRIEGFGQVYVGPTPSLDLLAEGAAVVPVGPRAWPLVEVVDRNEEPPGSGLVSHRVVVAIRSMLDRGGTVFVFTHRRGYAPAYRCAECRELRRCRVCGSRPEPGEACVRCGAPAEPCLACGATSFEPLGAGAGRVANELSGVFGDAVGSAGATPVVVGTERDLAGVEGVDLAVAVDADGLTLGSHFRAGEEALRILARLAGRVRRGSGHRLMVQTSEPDHPVIVALRRGDPLAYLHHELEQRRTMGYPPATEMLVVEARGDGASVDDDLRSIADAEVTVMGPADSPEGRRWLVQGPGLGGYKLALRPLVQRWRDSGTAVRIDVDPLDL